MQSIEVQESPTTPQRASLRRSWLLLALLSVVTVVLCVALLEGLARWLYPAWGSTLPCLVLSDASTGVRARPRSVCVEKIRESAPVEYRFNDCGFRTPMPCGPKPPGVFRVVLIGSSLAEGMRVAQPDTFAARLPQILSETTGRKVEVYSEAMQWGTPAAFARRTDQILAAQPDLVLWTLTPWDVENVSLVLPYVAGVQNELDQDEANKPEPLPSESGSLRQRITTAMHKYGSPSAVLSAAWSRAIDPLQDSDMVFLLQHLLYGSPSQYLRHYTMQGDSAGFLRTKTPSHWLHDYALLRQDVHSVAAPLRQRNIPLVMVVLPHRAQAVMLSTGDVPHGFDPLRMPEVVEPMIQQEGGTYVDILQDFRSVPDAGSLYLPMDGHMTAKGQQVLADVLARELTNGNVLALRPTQQKAGGE